MQEPLVSHNTQHSIHLFSSTYTSYSKLSADPVFHLNLPKQLIFVNA
ncbi:hypothetical protein PROFUN_15899 [Planoprotostelium fungivorum]|uniref:Uncharacterized protein n=1 Tax=Planoprotostelium fungivorum TaxID=1890364 RepID=A0A2P6MU03_9EUKA|nr:hypothetical protein PROFUN_15899 [Planoprotostelium fungivorum]